MSRRSRPRRLYPYLPAAGWAAFLLVLGTRPDLPGPATGLPLDKVAHFAAYGVLGALAGRGWVRTRRRPAAPLVVLFGVLVGVTDELLQSLVPTRTAELGDLVADAAGVMTGFLLAARRYARHRTADAHD